MLQMWSAKALISDKLAGGGWSRGGASSDAAYSGLDDVEDSATAPHSFLAAAPAPHGRYESLPDGGV